MARLRFSLALFTGLVVMAAADPAAAQSTIAGAVRDTTGAVLPGVTVEASSPVLIEKARATVTNAEGRYTIIDVRPGTYALTFTLAGFSTVRLAEIIVQANVSVPINAEMKIGTLDETITVAAASPVVDVQNVGRTQVMTRDMMDDIPNARNIQAVGSHGGDDGRAGGAHQPARRRHAELHRQPVDRGSQLQDQRRRRR